MCALIAMAVYSTEENKKDYCLDLTLKSLFETVDFTKHRLKLSVNGHTERTLQILDKYESIIKFIYFNSENIGTAEAINKVWKDRNPGEYCVKIDDDVVIHQKGWLDLLEECINRDNSIGIIGLKRKDCWENPAHTDPQYRSVYKEIAHNPGERWLTVEVCKHIIGTCQLYNSKLLDKIGYLYQPGLYGYDDVLASYRSEIAGYYNCFLNSIEIDHIDDGQTPFQGWKERHSGQYTQEVISKVTDYINDNSKIYYNPFK